MSIDRLDHLVLTVRDLDATCDFYRRVLGMDVVTFGAGRLALRFGRQKINLHRAGGGMSLVAERPTPGSGDLCLISERPLTKWIEHLAACQIPVVEGPGRRAGAEGPIESIYVRDPDGNLVEISNVVDPDGGSSGTSADEIAPLREWLQDLQAAVRAVDFEAGRRLCAPEMFAFGTVAPFVSGLDHVMAEQWRNVWPAIREFTIRADLARGAVIGDRAWVAAPWDSLGVRADGSTFPRPGRATVVLERRGGRWLATHTHFSLFPSPASGS
jgi:catechol 2,3-dioxygenase-like lactoylglutathione lyase family enzyme/ketosteroid isomerase-like protein